MNLEIDIKKVFSRMVGASLLAISCQSLANGESTPHYPLRVECKSAMGELVFKMFNSRPSQSIGMSFGLGGVRQTMTSEESRPHAPHFGTIALFSERSSGIIFEADFGFEMEMMPPKFNLKIRFGDVTSNYVTLDSGICRTFDLPN